MTTLGEALRSARQEGGLSLAQLEAITKIRRKYLLALENGNFAELPPPVYSRGYVRTISGYLGLDAAAMVALYEQARPQAELVGVQREVRPPRAPGAITGRTLVTMVLLVALGAAGYYLYQQYSLFVASARAPLAVRLPGDGALGPTPQPALAAGTTIEAPATPSPAPTVTPQPTATPIPGVHIEVKVVERSWLRVLVDEREVYQGIPQLGSELRWDGQDKIFMRTGNAAGVEVTFNGKPQGKLGAFGEVKDVQWTAAR